MPFSEPGLLRASLSLTGCIPSGPAAVGDPGTGGMPSAMEAYCGSGWGTVATATTQKKLGSFYTPPEVARALVRWVVRKSSDRLLDPACGETLAKLFAEHDASVPDHVIPDLRAALARTDVKNTIKIFPGTHHGFAFPERAVYETIASEQTWTDMFAMWDRHLK